MGLLVVVGHLNVEDTAYPEKPLIQAAPGGAALYASAGARLWTEEEVGLVSRIGEDYPEHYLAEIRSAGIELAGLRKIPGKTMAGCTEYDAAGARTYQMYVDRDRRAQLTPEPADLPRDWLRKETFFHLATMPPQSQEAWILAIKDRTSYISLDTDISFVRKTKKLLVSLLSSVDAFFPNEEEALSLAATQEVSEAAEEIARFGPKIVGIKRGEQGIHIYDGWKGEHFTVPAIQSDVLDVTGAGDAFCGGFLAGYGEHENVLKAAWQGSTSAAMAIEGYGALHLFRRTREEAAKRLRKAKGE